MLSWEIKNPVRRGYCAHIGELSKQYKADLQFVSARGLAGELQTASLKTIQADAGPN